ncbi:hypothetical protein M0Q97_10445 [Candidatus Dojkabacteria bacterium]|nr:hypothetical protein [Candidatus Dojkabacteria bacterium]
MGQLKNDTIQINVTCRNITHLKNNGYDVKIGDVTEIKIEHLSEGSHIKVIAICGCGKETELSYHKYLDNKNRYDYYSCKKCSIEKKRKTYLINYGVDNPMKNKNIQNKVESTNLEKYGVKTTLLDNKTKEKIKQTINEKYGVDEILSSPEIRNKTKKSMIEKYNVEYPIQNKEIQNKIKQTNLKKFGVEYPTQNIDIYNKIKQTNLERYGHISPIKSQIVKDKLKKKYIDYYKNVGINIVDIDNKNKLIINCDKCTKNFKISKILFNHKLLKNIELCPICNPPSKSNNEILLQKFILDKYNNEILINKKNIISPLELDIYLPDLKLAFEYNGIYWHNELHKDDNYHLNKTELCEQQGIQLIHIYEDDWLYKQNIVKSMILNKLGKTPNKIFARKCEIKEITDNKLIRTFLNDNHIQGFVGSKIKIGLFYDNELVSLMTFGDRRVAMGKKSTNEGEYELLRFCNKLNTNVVGGASRLFKYFNKNYNPTEITTYADRSFSQGNLYDNLGFKFVGKTQPNYYYVIYDKRYHRFNFRKNILIDQGFDSNKTEHEIMLERKIYRIYDSGNLKFIKEYKN